MSPASNWSARPMRPSRPSPAKSPSPIMNTCAMAWPCSLSRWNRWPVAAMSQSPNAARDRTGRASSKACSSNATPRPSRCAWLWITSTPTPSPRSTKRSRPPRAAAWPIVLTSTLHAQTRQLAQHCRNRAQRSQWPMSAPPHPRYRTYAPPNFRLAKPPQQPRRSHQLALHHRRCPHQTAQNLSKIVAVTEH